MSEGQCGTVGWDTGGVAWGRVRCSAFGARKQHTTHASYNSTTHLNRQSMPLLRSLHFHCKQITTCRDACTTTCTTTLHAPHHYMHHTTTCTTPLHAPHHYMHHTATCITPLHAPQTHAPLHALHTPAARVSPVLPFGAPPREIDSRLQL